MRAVTPSLLAICLFAYHATVCRAEAPRPNIILIVADDLGYGDLGCYGQQLIRTPNIDRLADEGMRFTQAYAGAPVCTASRSVLMTGLHNGHSPARDNVPHYDTYLQDDDVTVAEILKQAGYRTGGVGKWSLGDAGTVGRATNQGFDTWFGYLNQDHAHYYFTEYLDDDDGRLDLRGNRQTHQHYSHDLLTQRALAFIERVRDDRRPFFLYAALTLPHFSAKAEDPDGLAVPSTAPYSDRDWDERAKKYAAMIHRLDRDVGRITQLVDRSGLTQDTLMIVTSDNGPHSRVCEDFKSNGSLKGFKRDLTEGGIRVPFIVRWPGTTPANQISDDVIAFQDMLPTFAELAGATPPTSLDGLSVANAISGGPLGKRQHPLYWDYGHCRRRYDQAVRWKDWKGIRLGQDGEIQLYDLSKDSSESNNIAADHPDIVNHIAQVMKTATIPSQRYPIGQLYRGMPRWTPPEIGALNETR